MSEIDFDNTELSMLHRDLKLWDRKLTRLSDEKLYYVFNKASKIIENRMEKENEHT